MAGLVAVGLSLIAVAQARAADGWMVEELRGTVVRLEGDHWQEVLKGEQLGSSMIVRSLTNSRAILRTDSLRLRLGAKTTVEAVVGTRLISLDQYSGTIEVVLATNSPVGVTVRTPGIVVSSAGGRLSVEVNGDITEIAVLSGTAEALDIASGRVLVLKDGQEADDLRAEIIEAPTSGAQVATAPDRLALQSAPDTPPPASTPPDAAPSTGGAAGNSTSSNAGGNPNSNAGGNPNSNAGGNPNSNAGGNPNSNAGGNPNSNAGDNPNSNAGGNPNSNAGGSNANAGGSSDSNAGGSNNSNSNSNAGGNNGGGGKSNNNGNGS